MRALRCQHVDRAKGKARKILLRWNPNEEPAPDQVGKMAATHCRPCSCWMCASHKQVPPMRERRFSDQ